MPLQVGDGFVRYLKDHVLDDMVRGLGGEILHELAPFEPEGGAYGGHAHGHAHGAHAHD
jgi:urease accessory protein